MPRNGSSIYSLPAGSIVTDGTTIEASQHNTPLNDLVTDANTPRAVVVGGTGATTAADALVNLGLTATAAEINTLDGITATTAELNILDGVTATAAELNILDGVTATASEINALDGVTATGTALIQAADAAAARTAIDFPAGLNASGSAPIYACRAWVDFDGTGTVAINGSGNVSSITDNGTGDYTVNFTTAMPDANYAVLTYLSAGTLNTVQYTSKFASRTAASVRILTLAGTTATDFVAISVAIFR